MASFTDPPKMTIFWPKNDPSKILCQAGGQKITPKMGLHWTLYSIQGGDRAPPWILPGGGL